MNNLQEKEREIKISRLMAHCDDCDHDDTECINSFSGNDHVSPWYEMRCRNCGAVWTVYDR